MGISTRHEGKIHVLHLIGSTGLYGAERWILALMGALDHNRIQSSLVNLVDNKNETSEVVTAARNRGFRALDFHTGGNYNPLAALRLARWVKGQKVHIIHGHGFKSDMTGLLAARVAGCRAVTTPHGWSLEKNRKLELYERLDRGLFRFMDAVCPLSQALKKDIENCAPPAALRLILNGVDVEEVQAASPPLRLRSGAFVIGYMGRLVELKDLNTLLAAIRHLCDRQLKIHLVIIGDGPEKADLFHMAARLGITERVNFLGFRADPLPILKTFDVFVLPSLTEGIPRCIMEAMAAGIPVIVSDIPGNRALVSHGETGLLFLPGNSSDLAEKIEAVMNDPVKAMAMAASGQKKIEDNYSSRKMGREYTKLYDELVGRC